MPRLLWTAVVLQAAADINGEHYRSPEYSQAVAFFTAAGGEWAESRQNIADALELHPDDLTRLGKAAIAARHLRDGPEPVIVRTGTRQPPTTRPEPRLTNPVPVAARPTPQPSALSRKDRDWIKRFVTRRAA